MRILIDINHPAHVHYFKNFVWEMQKRGHDVLVTASTKDITKQLLEIYKLPYVISGNYAKGSIKKVLHLFAIDLAVLKIARNFNPDVFIGFGSIQDSVPNFL